LSLCDSAHCGIGTCSNFYVENGIRYCAKSKGPTSFRGQRTSFTGQGSGNRPDIERLKQQFNRIKRAANILALQDKLRAIECSVLRARVDKIINDARELHKDGCFDDSPKSLRKRVATLENLVKAMHAAGMFPDRTWFQDLGKSLVKGGD
jgi:hypothetical protein